MWMNYCEWSIKNHEKQNKHGAGSNTRLTTAKLNWNCVWKIMIINVNQPIKNDT